MASFAEVDKTLFGGLLPGGATRDKEPGQTSFTQGVSTPEERAIRECRANGGRWDARLKECILPEQPKAEEPKPEEPKKLTPEEKAAAEAEGSNIITDAQGNERIQTKRDVELLSEGLATDEQLAAEERVRLRNQQLAGQVGQFQQTGVSPTGFDVEQGILQGLVGAIPRALSLAGAAAAGGAAIGATVGAAGAPVTAGISVPVGAAIGGAITFAGTLASSITSEFKGQRRDTINAQKRVLDEGKQTMKDWATMAEADPANKAYYLSQFNKVAQQIDAAYRQMKLDTQRDVTKFNTALPDLAEFETFYAIGGERDALVQEMQNSILSQADPTYKLMELSTRYGNSLG